MRKRRTREHIIADLSVNHVERFVLRCGHVVNRVIFDYGYDLFVQTFNERGEIEPGYCQIQLKATDAPNYLTNGRDVSITIERRDWDFWLEETMPVFLVLYDTPQDTAYWIQIQASLLLNNQGATTETITIRLSRENVVNEIAIQTFRERKDEANRQEKRKYGTDS